MALDADGKTSPENRIQRCILLHECQEQKVQGHLQPAYVRLRVLDELREGYAKRPRMAHGLAQFPDQAVGPCECYVRGNLYRSHRVRLGAREQAHMPSSTEASCRDDMFELPSCAGRARLTAG